MKRLFFLELATMRALSILEPGRLELVDVALPTLSEGWVRIRVSHVGICGTDYHIFEGSHPFVDYPRIIGHELSGRVSDPGSADFAVGDAVVVNPYLNCGHCPACRAGTPNCCETLNVLGVHTDGGMCEEIVVPATNVYSAHGLNSSDAAMVEFLAIGAHAVRRTEITANERTLVIGAGPIGLGTAIFARIAGAEVTLLDTAVEKIAAASALGFAAFELSDIDRPAFADRRGTGFDAVFDATGSPPLHERGYLLREARGRPNSRGGHKRRPRLAECRGSSPGANYTCVEKRNPR